MEIDQVEPGFMVQKELQLRFTFAYDQNEFAELPLHLDRACQMILSFCTVGIQPTMTQFNA